MEDDLHCSDRFSQATFPDTTPRCWSSKRRAANAKASLLHLEKTWSELEIGIPNKTLFVFEFISFLYLCSEFSFPFKQALIVIFFVCNFVFFFLKKKKTSGVASFL